MLVYRSKETPLGLRSSSSTAATCCRVSECHVSTKSFNQVCNCCFKSVSFRGGNACPTCSSSENVSNYSADNNSSVANCFKINKISSLSYTPSKPGEYRMNTVSIALGIICQNI